MESAGVPTVLLADIPEMMKADDLLNLLGSKAQVQCLKFINPEKAKRIALVTFSSAEDVTTVVREFNFHKISDRAILRVTAYDRSMSSSALRRDGDVYVRLPPGFTESALREVLKDVDFVDLKFFEGHALVQLKDEDVAHAMINGLRVENGVLNVSKYLTAEEFQENNLKIENIGVEFTEAALKEKFSQFGRIASAAVQSEYGRAFVCFEKKASASAACALNGMELPDGRRLKVGFAKYSSNEEGKNIRITTGFRGLSEEFLRTEFRRFGTISQVTVQQRAAVTVAFVNFDSPQSAMNAKRATNGKRLRGWGGIPVTVDVCRPRTDRGRA